MLSGVHKSNLQHCFINSLKVPYVISKRVRYISNQGTPFRNIVNISLQLDGFLFYCLTDSSSNVTEKNILLEFILCFLYQLCTTLS